MTKFQVFTASFFLTNLMACSAKVSSDTPPVPDAPVIKEVKPSWAADIQGSWTSDCMPAQLNFDHTAKITAVYDAANFDRVYTEYSDVNCQTKVASDEMKGTFKFTDQASNGVATATYFLSQSKYGKVQANGYALVDSGTLYYSEPGDGNVRAAKESLIKLTKVGAPVPTASPAPTPAPAATCLNVAGKYQMNSSYIELVQTGCSQVVLKNYGDNPYGGAPTTTTYVTDGAYHDVNSTQIKSYFASSALDIEYTDSSGRAIRNEWSLSARPCSLANPDGQTYLMRQTYINGTVDDDRCLFYARNNF